MNTTPKRMFFGMLLAAWLFAPGCFTEKVPPTDEDQRASQLAADAERFAANLSDDDVAWEGEPVQPHFDPNSTPPPIPPTVRRTEISVPAHDMPPAPAPDVDHTPAPQAEVITVTREMTDAEILAALADRLRRDTRQANSSLRPWLSRAALAAIDPKYELTNAELSSLSQEDRRIVQAYQRLFARVGQTQGESTTQDRQTFEDLAEELSDAIAQQRPLTIRNMKLCKKVNGFGVYEPFEKNIFLAGQNHPVIVYAELENFQADVGGDGKHRVRLSQEVVIYNDADGLPVWRQRPVAITDESFNRRQDFFVVQVIRLSDRLTVGKYQLKVTITDEVGRSVDEATMPLQIVADAALVRP